MASGGSADVSGADVDLYGILGLKRECSDADLKLAYRRLAMTWHPDRCSASGSSARVEEAKERFQEIQGAYSVLSDSGKRLLYDVGVYDSDDDDNYDERDVSGMGDFLGDLAEMMSQETPTESFEELQQLFVDMFQADLVGGFGFSVPAPPPLFHRAQARSQPCTTSGSTSCDGANKRCSSSMGPGVLPRSDHSGSGPGLSGFSFKESEWRRREEDTSIGGAKKKQRFSTSHSVSSEEDDDEQSARP